MVPEAQNIVFGTLNEEEPEYYPSHNPQFSYNSPLDYAEDYAIPSGIMFLLRIISLQNN